MCLLIARFHVDPDVPLIVAANRDELHDRPAEPTGLLRTEPHPTLGIRDLVAGGTALAVNDSGVVAALTNKPSGGHRDPAKRSRGEIPLALTEYPSAAEAAQAFTERFEPQTFNPCWVLVGDRESLLYIDLSTDEVVNPQEVAPGTHVLENAPLGEPTPKARYVNQQLKAHTPLEALLKDHTQPGESPVSAPCVHTEVYGTRSATVVRVPADIDAPPEVRASDGPSCVNPLERVRF